MLTVIILTLNEDIHLERCLSSLSTLDANLIIVDSFSSDKTSEIACHYGCLFVQNKFVNHSAQFNFALTQLPSSTSWILRMDADEYLTPELAKNIKAAVEGKTEYVGFYLRRQIAFGGKIIKFGGVSGVEVLRLFKHGFGRCENRWMDEHIEVDGLSGRLDGYLIDDNKKSLTFWIQKHNLYSNREAVEVLKWRHLNRSVPSRISGSAKIKRIIKENIYYRLPVVSKVFIYFIYRYIFRLGFLDGREGFFFHFLQGFWYRFLVEIKVIEVERHLAKGQSDFHEVVENILNVRL